MVQRVGRIRTSNPPGFRFRPVKSLISRVEIRTARAALLSLTAAALVSCAPAINLLNPASPRFVGEYATPALGTVSSPAPLRIVTFNIKLARRIDRAIEVLQSDSLRGADIIALEEMDNTGVDRIARALRLNYAYYPASIHPTDHKYFGPAILSRWPIEQSWKLLLPHEARFRRQRRTATGAIVRVQDQRVRVYAVHLETPVRISESGREDQVQAVLFDASGFDGPVVIAGDFNSYGVGPYLVRHGYRWLTSKVGSSISIFSWDHIFVRDLSPARPASAGVVREVRGASDHHPVWAVVMPETRGLASLSAAR
jgi:endonuclease/exonuclease/phosphatase family metal-dependent hydrolase